jgi:F-type H+-transporting ATPase subunit alpha
LARGERLTELLKQPQNKPLSVAEQVISMFAGVRGYLDTINTKEISSFVETLLEKMHKYHREVIDAIETSGQLSDDSENALKDILSEHTQSFKNTH